MPSQVGIKKPSLDANQNTKETEMFLFLIYSVYESFLGYQF